MISRYLNDLVKGDVITLEYYEPYDVEFEGQIHLSEIIHDYKDILNFDLNLDHTTRVLFGSDCINYVSHPYYLHLTICMIPVIRPGLEI